MTIPNDIDIFKGDDGEFECTVKDRDGNIVDLTGAKIYVYVNVSVKDITINPIIEKANSDGGGGDSEILIQTPATNGKFDLFIDAADTTNEDAGEYRYKAKVDLGGKLKTIISSVFNIEE